MALSDAQQALLAQIAAKAQSGQLTRQPFVVHGVRVAMPNPGWLRLELKNRPPLAVVNAWIGACAAQFGSARQRPSPDGQVIIDVALQ